MPLYYIDAPLNVIQLLGIMMYTSLSAERLPGQCEWKCINQLLEQYYATTSGSTSLGMDIIAVLLYY